MSAAVKCDQQVGNTSTVYKASIPLVVRFVQNEQPEQPIKAINIVDGHKYVNGGTGTSTAVARGARGAGGHFGSRSSSTRRDALLQRLSERVTFSNCFFRSRAGSNCGCESDSVDDEGEESDASHC